MSYTLLTGRFFIRYADAPLDGPEPDGDTIKFLPDSRELVGMLPRLSNTPPKLNSRGINVRLEGVDTLETHFEPDHHQELAGANAGRDLLLAELGFTNVRFFERMPNKVESSDQDAVAGFVLSNGIDDNGRMIGFVYAGDSDRPDGASVFVDDALLDASINTTLLSSGHAYPAFYETLPVELRDRLGGLSQAARESQPPRELWARSTADPNGPATIASVQDAEQLVIWPKLFRRIISFFGDGFRNFDRFDSWLRDPVNGDDRVFLLQRREHGNLHDIVRASGQTIQLTEWPEDFIILPARASTTPVGARPPVIADVLVVAALPNPAGSDAGNESITLLNVSSATIELAGWRLSDMAGGAMTLDGELAGGATMRVALGGGLQLGNSGDTIVLSDGAGGFVDRVSYRSGQARAGRSIAFGR